MSMDEYDYVIVGAGSAGCVLADGLSADPDTRVLLLEAGGRDINPWIHIPLGWPRLLDRRMNDWMYFTEPEPQMDGREIECARGKVLGGSSSVNAMAWVRGHRGDFDRWARMGLNGWSYADVLPIFKEQECWEAGDSAYRGGSGPMSVIFNRYCDPITDAFLEAGQQAGHPFTDDYNGETQEGFGRWQSSIRNGRRCSAATAWLAPARKRPNLSLQIGAHVTSVDIEGGAARGVTYAKGKRTHQVRARHEVLLCGGVFNTPQLLMLSGIGEADALQRLGIRPLADRPGVGRNLQDHISAAAGYVRSAPGPLHRAMRADRIVPALANTSMFGRGIANDLPAAGMAFLRSEEAGELPDVQLFCIAAPMAAAPWLPPFRSAYQDGYAIRVAVLRPESIGQVSLASADPFVAPRIEQNFLSAEKDWRALRAGLRLARHAGSRPALARYAAGEIAPRSDDRSDLDAHVRRSGVSVHHPLGTCRMGLPSDDDAVLDDRLRVIGVDRLRVVDASAMPDMIGGNINAAVMMLAGKAARMIAADRAAGGP